MKYSTIFENRLGCKDADQTFEFFKSNLIETISSFNFFVDWEKIYDNVSELEMDLNLLNYLIGKDDIKSRMETLLNKHPSIIRTFPILLAVRSNELIILRDNPEREQLVQTYNFKKRTILKKPEIEDLIGFCEKTGLLDLLQNHINSNLVDYAMGIEVGLDTNARKNRHGHDMENLVEKVLKRICDQHHYKFMKEATAKRLLLEWGYKVKVDKNKRRFDFAVLTNKNLYLFETNYYSGGGSKLKATAGEYQTIYNYLNEQGISFIWITDGLGWRSALNPLRETFDYIDYVLNLQMIRCGLLADILEMDL